jgi:hypothetical protein
MAPQMNLLKEIKTSPDFDRLSKPKTTRRLNRPSIPYTEVETDIESDDAEAARLWEKIKEQGKKIDDMMVGR